MTHRILLSGVALGMLAACASHPPPTQHLGAALAAASEAEEAGASRVPPAELHLSLAREQVEQAERMIEDGMNERANDMTIRAYNDAQLAAALAREAEAKAELRQVHEEMGIGPEGSTSGSLASAASATGASDATAQSDTAQRAADKGGNEGAKTKQAPPAEQSPDRGSAEETAVEGDERSSTKNAAQPAADSTTPQPEED